MAEPRIVKILRLGIVSHSEIDEKMRRLQNARLDEQIDDTLIFVEHPEIVTIGPKARRENISIPKSYKTSEVDRGGGITYHGPGQLVVYPIFKWDLEEESNVKKITSKLEKWAIAALNKIDIEANTDERMQGIWLNDYKVGSVGLSFMRWVSRHGFTINYATNPGRVEGLQGCGLENGLTTSLAALNHPNLTRDDLEGALISTIQTNLNRIHAKS
ncbi:MAG: lipoyl(octanoyl) transferase LipB [Candidatus Thalassarchaeaceae archaeon]|jgi:lipoate-protein ligase B|nr:lipoyl(octanoyl) transferase LipB [Candidatus Thalassarchaeaceae archaeon]